MTENMEKVTKLEPLETSDATVIGSDEKYHEEPGKVLYLLNSEGCSRTFRYVEWHEVEDTICFFLAPIGAMRIFLKANRGVRLLESLEVFADYHRRKHIGTLTRVDQELCVEDSACYVVAKYSHPSNNEKRPYPYMLNLLAYCSE